MKELNVGEGCGRRTVKEPVVLDVIVDPLRLQGAAESCRLKSVEV